MEKELAIRSQKANAYQFYFKNYSRLLNVHLSIANQDNQKNRQHMHNFPMEWRKALQ